jgi:aminoglycoside phosphotransferase (APT) family kinase protein
MILRCRRIGHVIFSTPATRSFISNRRNVTEPFVELLSRFAAGSTLLRTRVLAGGMSAAVTLVEFVDAAGVPQKVVVRVHGERDRAQNPQVAEHEYALLQALHRSGAPVPRPIFVDSSDRAMGSPCVVIEFIEGSTTAPSESVAIPQLSRALAALHAVAWRAHDLGFLKATSQVPPALAPGAAIDNSMSETRIRTALALHPPVQPNGTALLHGDFWPGNVLWRGDQLAAVIDWEDAALGDALTDLANSRMEMLWAFGADGMQAFTRAYLALTPTLDTRALPCWDLLAALRPCGQIQDWGLPDADERRMRQQHAWFVAQAIDKLPSTR